MVSLRRPPKMIALIGTPAGSSTSGSSTGLFRIGVAKRLLGWAPFSFEAGVQGLPRQSIASLGGGPSLPSHQGSPAVVRATFVKSVSRSIARIAFAFDL